MNFSIMKALIFKDWYLQRWWVLSSVVVGGLALFLLGNGGTGAFYTGSLLLPTVLISIGAQLAMGMVVNERKEKTLPFVLSLPVSPLEYASAKIIGIVLIFLVPFFACLFGTVMVILGREAIPDGLVPFSVIMLSEIFVTSAIILAVAIITESQGWTIGAIVFGNLAFNGMLYLVTHIPEIKDTMSSATVVWTPPALLLLMGEVVCVFFIIVFTFFFQSRKKDFL